MSVAGYYVKRMAMNDDLKTQLADHERWLAEEDGGRRANLRRANLRRANLYGANLGGADLYRANLGGADLQEADLGAGRFFWQGGPYGPRDRRPIVSNLDGDGLQVSCGCYLGSAEEVKRLLAERADAWVSSDGWTREKADAHLQAVCGQIDIGVALARHNL